MPTIKHSVISQKDEDIEDQGNWVFSGKVGKIKTITDQPPKPKINNTVSESPTEMTGLFKKDPIKKKSMWQSIKTKILK